MTFIEFFANKEKNLRKFYSLLPPWFVALLYSNGRKAFLNTLINQSFPKDSSFNRNFGKKKLRLWDIDFNSNLFNAAGMFKFGYGYELCVYQGAGAFLAGTTTANLRYGNKKNGILHPFTAFPLSGTAINWMGLPNEGHSIVASRLSKIEKIPGFPVGASLASSPDQHGLEALKGLLSGLNDYEKAGVDFIELNESCPNVSHDSCTETINGIDKYLIERLEFVSNEFLLKRKRNLPVVVKFSVDTSDSNINELVKVLIDLKFDGINFGNTSTDYEYASQFIDSKERNNFDYFINEFGGGISGKALNRKSLMCASSAAKLLKELNPSNEFHIIRTGGISAPTDLLESETNGIMLNEWFTGYFENFADYGHRLYEKM